MNTAATRGGKEVHSRGGGGTARTNPHKKKSKKKTRRRRLSGTLGRGPKSPLIRFLSTSISEKFFLTFTTVVVLKISSLRQKRCRKQHRGGDGSKQISGTNSIAAGTKIVPVEPWGPRKIFLSSKMMNSQPQDIQK